MSRPMSARRAATPRSQGIGRNQRPASARPLRAGGGVGSRRQSGTGNVAMKSRPASAASGRQQAAAPVSGARGSTPSQGAQLRLAEGGGKRVHPAMGARADLGGATTYVGAAYRVGGRKAAPSPAGSVRSSPSRGGAGGGGGALSGLSVTGGAVPLQQRAAAKPASTSAKAAEEMVAAKMLAGFQNAQEVFARCDRDGNGTLSYDEFRSALRAMGAKLTARETAKLAAKYDRNMDGNIDYTEFTTDIAQKTGLADEAGVETKLFQTTTARSKKGASSEQAAALRRKMAERIANRFTSVTRAFRELDEDHSGTLSREEVLHALQRMGVDTSDPAVEEVIARLDGNKDDRITMEEFRQQFGEFVHAQETESPFLRGREAGTGAERLGADPRRAREHRDFTAATSMYTNTDDAIHAWQTKLANRFNQVSKAFRTFDKDHSGGLTMDELHDAIRSCGIEVDKEHMREMFDRVNKSHTGLITFDEFRAVAGGAIAGESDATGRPGGRAAAAGAKVPMLKLGQTERRTEHRDHSLVTSTFTDSRAAVHAFKAKLANNFSEVRKAFRRFDTDHSGSLTMGELHQAIRSCGIDVDEEHMQQIYDFMDKDHDGRINYAEFNKLVGSAIHGGAGGAGRRVVHLPTAAEERKAKVAAQRERRAQLDAGSTRLYETAEGAQQAFRAKLANKFSKVRTAWRMADENGDNAVSINELHRALLLNGIDLSRTELQRLFDGIDTDASGTISFEEFRQAVGTAIQSSHVEGGVMPGMGEEYKSERIKSHEGATSRYSSAEAAEAAFMFKINNKFKQVRQAFRAYDVDHSGDLSIRELQKAINSCGVGVTEDQLMKIFRRFDIDGDEKISYREFNLLVGEAVYGKTNQGMFRSPTPDPKKARYVALHKDKFAPVAEFATQRAANAEAAEQQMRVKLANNFSSVRRAFRAFDTDHDGKLSKPELEDALRRCGMTLSPAEMDALFEAVDWDGTGSVRFQDFVKVFGEDIAGARERPATPRAEASPTRGDETAAFSGRFGTLERAFREADQDNSGALTAHELREALAKSGVKLSGPEFAALRRLYDVDGDGLVSWKEFKAHLMGQGDDSQLSTARKAAIPFSHRKKPKHFTVPDFADTATNEAEDKLLSAMYGGWAAVTRSLRQGDYNGDGFVGRREFLEALRRNDVHLPESELRVLLDKYDLRGDGTVAYEQFADGVSKLVAPKGDGVPRAQTPSRPARPMSARERRPASRGGLSTDSAARSRPQSARPRSSPRRESAESSGSAAAPAPAHRTTFRRTEDLSGQHYERGKLVERRHIRAETHLRSKVAAGAHISPRTHQAVRDALARFDFVNVHRAFQKLDTAKNGCLPAFEFGTVLERFGISVDDRQFRALFKAHEAPELVDGRHQVRYADFIRAYRDVAQETLAKRQRGLVSPRRPLSSQRARMSGRAQFVGGRWQMPDGSDARLEDQVEAVVKREWKGMRKILKAFDANKDGFIDAGEFQRILRHYNVDVSRSQARELMKAYDMDADGFISYAEFLKANLRKGKARAGATRGSGGAGPIPPTPITSQRTGGWV